MEVINYKELVTDYNESLVNVLRGFRPKAAFVEMWVPDADHSKSIINLVEAAQIHGEDSFRISVANPIWKEINQNSLISEMKKMGSVEVQAEADGAIIQVSHLCGGDKSRSSQSDFKNINPIYVEKLKSYLAQNRYEKTITDEEGRLLLRSSINGVSLFASMDTKRHVILDVAYTGAASQEQRAVLEAFCHLIEGLPIQEASDHGIIRLEYSLREKTIRPVPGILNVFNMDPILQFPNQLMRDLLANYSQQVGLKDTKNFWTQMASKDWRELSDEGRVQKVQKFIDENSARFFPIGTTVRVSQIEQVIKISVLFEGALTSHDKAKGLMGMERVAREQIEGRIQFYMDSVKDRNKARRL